MNLAGCSVLVIDDHPFARRTIMQILANLGAGAVLEADGGPAALTMLDDGVTPDIIVLDLDLPGTSSMSFMRELAARGDETAVLIVSGIDPAEVAVMEAVARDLPLHVIGAIAKPPSARHLLDAIAFWC